MKARHFRKMRKNVLNKKWIIKEIDKAVRKLNEASNKLTHNCKLTSSKTLIRNKGTVETLVIIRNLKRRLIHLYDRYKWNEML